MAGTVTLEPEVIIGSLVEVLKQLAGAIAWVCQQDGPITFPLPDEPKLGPEIGPVCGGCAGVTRPPERCDHLVFDGILNVMPPNGVRRPKVKAKARPRRRR
jgi:hypothetical protein